MAKRRLDARDTVDTVIHQLHKLQSEGWCLEACETVIGYAQPGKKSVRLPTHTTLIIRLRPVKDD